MKKMHLSQLVTYSYTREKLDEKKVFAIANSLSRKDLKMYIRGLTLAEKKRKVYIAIPTKKLYNETKKIFEGIFEGKELILQEDPSLLLGARIVDNDIVYDMSLKESIATIANQIEEI